MTSKKTTITVNDIRYAIQDLPGTAAVLVRTQQPLEWGTHNERELVNVTGAHDGRFGNILLVVLGGFVTPYNAAGVEEHESSEQEVGEDRRNPSLPG